jgi:hypothetical protein
MRGSVHIGRFVVGLGGGLGLVAAGSLAAAQPATSSIVDAINAGKPIIEVRSRYEHVDQPNLANDADAFTTRLLIGWQTAEWNRLQAQVVYKVVQHIGAGDFNTTINGRTAFPVVADPDTHELDRAQVTWSPSRAFQATIGRQRILIDDQRFVGDAGWRQDEQTFDAARVDFHVAGLKATYAYLEKANRVFATAQDWSSDSHLLNASYALAEPLRLEAFFYALDFKQSPANSTETWGVKASGALRAAAVKLAYDATWARQSDYRNNPGRFGLDFWAGDATASYGIATLKATYESLQGDGARGFGTPLATLHAHLGWDDVFLTTPKDGLRNLNLALELRPKAAVGPLHGLDLIGRAFDFHAERTGQELGREWDISLGAVIAPRLTALIKFAQFDAATPTVVPFVSRRKFWAMLEYKL